MKRLILLLCFMSILTACGSKHEPKPMILPESGTVKEITLEHNDVKAVCYDKAWIFEFMNVLAEIGTSTRESVNDIPTNVDDFIKVNLICNDNSTTSFFYYESSGVSYIEQPYQGIFVPEPVLGTNIYALLNNEDAREEEETESYYDLFGTNTPAVILNGRLYYNTGKDSTRDHTGNMDGAILSTVDGDEVPKEDNQSNFGIGYLYQFNNDNTVDINIKNDRWVVFQTDDPETEKTSGQESETAQEQTQPETSPQETEETEPETVEETETTETQTVQETEEVVQQETYSVTLSDMEGLYMIVTGVSEGSVTVTISNNTDRQIYAGDDFYIERLDADGVWRRVSEINPFSPTDASYQVVKGVPISMTINYSAVYGKLSFGDYRIVKILKDYKSDGSYDEYGYWAKFTAH